MFGKIARIVLLTFIASWMGSFFLSFALLNIFYEFSLISAAALLVTSFVIAVIFALVSVITTLRTLKAEEKSKFGNWVSCNSAKLGLTYILTIVFLFSVKAELFLTIEDIKEILSLAWTILGISIAMFLIWNVVLIEYLEKRKPQRPTSKSPTKTWLYIEEKSVFYSDATSLFGNITLLVVNLFILTFATIFAYVTNRQATLFSQSLTFLTLVLSTNSIFILFCDILKPFNEKKRLMLRETKVTNEDVDLENEIMKETESVLTAIDAVKNAESISDESKKEVISGILETFYKKFGATLTDEQSEKEE